MNKNISALKIAATQYATQANGEEINLIKKAAFEEGAKWLEEYISMGSEESKQFDLNFFESEVNRMKEAVEFSAGEWQKGYACACRRVITLMRLLKEEQNAQVCDATKKPQGTKAD